MSVERILHHFPLDPASRQVRLALGEGVEKKQEDFAAEVAAAAAGQA